jgi:7,8-dihydropterin-6-yl-methyl-4-(beta-D-ribofuranosyl)aminobenzene 5'-phosphate synthase
MRLTIVVENYTNRADLSPEYGLSIHVADGDASILMDTGQRDALFANAPLLGVDLPALQHIVLSHGHFDHVGALARLLMQTKAPVLWAHPAVMDLHSRFRRGRMTFIGCHLNREAVRFREITGLTRITENVFAMEIPAGVRNTEFVNTPEHLVVPLADGTTGTDPFTDDISLVVRGSRGLSVILGCAHAGVVNILEEAARRFGAREFDTVVGGMHIGDAPDEYVDRVTDTLSQRFRVRRWRPCHCTGIRSAWKLASKAQDVDWAGAGTILDV